MKLIFFGSDDFAQAHLEEILAQGFTVAACVTQPDRPKGRGMQTAVSPIKTTALRHKIDVLQPEDLKDSIFLRRLKSYKADLFVVIAYGRFLTEELLTMPQTGAINVHGSLLPKYRGAAPINWAILNGEKETGVTVMYLNKKMDAGDIIEQATLKIAREETAVSLRPKMIELGKKTLVKVLKALEKGKVRTKPQDESQVTFAPKLTKELGKIDWTQPARHIENKIRALQPWPGAYTLLNKKMLKILAAEAVSGKGRPGEITALNKEYMDIGTKEGLLRVYEVHLADAKPMSAAAFVRGQRLQEGFSLL